MNTFLAIVAVIAIVAALFFMNLAVAPPVEAIEQETRRQHEEAKTQHRRLAREDIQWRGKLRIKRGILLTLIIPMTSPEQASGHIAFNYSYRVGFFSASSAAFLYC